MSPAEIQAVLRLRLPESQADLSAPAAGDAYLRISAAALKPVCRLLREAPELDFDFLRMISGVEFEDRLASVYHLYSYRHGHSLTLRAELPKEKPQIESVADIWPAADWHERETFDLMGIVFQGHPELRRILLPLDWEGHPLRSDYQQPRQYHGVKND